MKIELIRKLKMLNAQSYNLGNQLHTIEEEMVKKFEDQVRKSHAIQFVFFYESGFTEEEIIDFYHAAIVGGPHLTDSQRQDGTLERMFPNLLISSVEPGKLGVNTLLAYLNKLIEKFTGMRKKIKSESDFLLIKQFYTLIDSRAFKLRKNYLGAVSDSDKNIYENYIGRRRAREIFPEHYYTLPEVAFAYGNLELVEKMYSIAKFFPLNAETHGNVLFRSTDSADEIFTILCSFRSIELIDDALKLLPKSFLSTSSMFKLKYITPDYYCMILARHVALDSLKKMFNDFSNHENYLLMKKELQPYILYSAMKFNAFSMRDWICDSAPNFESYLEPNNDFMFSIDNEQKPTYYHAFKLLFQHNALDEIHFNWKKLSVEKQKIMIRKLISDELYLHLLSNPNPNVLEWFWEKIEPEKQLLLLDNFLNKPYKWITALGEIEDPSLVLSKIQFLFDKTKNNSIDASKYRLHFKYASEHTMIEVLKWIWGISTNEEQDVLLTQDLFYAFCEHLFPTQSTTNHFIEAAHPRKDKHDNLRLSVMKWLWEKANKNQRKAMLETNKEYKAFENALRIGYFEVVKWLWGNANTEQRKAMLALFLSDKATHTIFIIWKWLWEKSTPEQQKEKLESEDFIVVEKVISKKNGAALNWLWGKLNPEQHKKIFNLFFIDAFLDAISKSDFCFLKCLYQHATNIQENILLSGEKIFSNQLGYGSRNTIFEISLFNFNSKDSWHPGEKDDSMMDVRWKIVKWLWKKHSQEEKKKVFLSDTFLKTWSRIKIRSVKDWLWDETHIFPKQERAILQLNLFRKDSEEKGFTNYLYALPNIKQLEAWLKINQRYMNTFNNFIQNQEQEKNENKSLHPVFVDYDTSKRNWNLKLKSINSVERFVEISRDFIFYINQIKTIYKDDTNLISLAIFRLFNNFNSAAKKIENCHYFYNPLKATTYTFKQKDITHFYSLIIRYVKLKIMLSYVYHDSIDKNLKIESFLSEDTNKFQSITIFGHKVAQVAFENSRAGKAFKEFPLARTPNISTWLKNTNKSTESLLKTIQKELSEREKNACKTNSFNEENDNNNNNNNDIKFTF